MKKVTTAVLSILREAVHNELDGKAMYLQAAERTKDVLGKSMFRSFAKEEDEHIHILQVQYAELNQTGDWLDPDDARKAPRDPALILFPQLEAEIKQFVPEGASDLEALKIAMSFEQRAVRMYEKAAADSDNRASQSFYGQLADWEATHYRILDNSRDYLAHKGEWYFQELEMPMYEG